MTNYLTMRSKWFHAGQRERVRGGDEIWLESADESRIPEGNWSERNMLCNNRIKQIISTPALLKRRNSLELPRDQSNIRW